jgi:predicted AAA+ superfamily ATPase
MHPLDFGEFLQFKGVKISSKIPTLHEFNLAFYNKHRSDYEEYLLFGGFPEVVLERDKKSKKAYLRDIINAYIELDIKLLSDFQATDDLYRLMKLIAARVGSKTDYSKISSLTGLHRQKVKDYFQLLEHTYFINTIPPFTKNADREISLQKKFYFSDTGVLNN